MQIERGNVTWRHVLHSCYSRVKGDIQTMLKQLTSYEDPLLMQIHIHRPADLVVGDIQNNVIKELKVLKFTLIRIHKHHPAGFV